MSRFASPPALPAVQRPRNALREGTLTGMITAGRQDLLKSESESESESESRVTQS